MNQIILEVKQNLDVDGWEDANGTVHYDDTIATPFGQLGQLHIANDGDDVMILQADETILVRHGFPTHWSSGIKGVSIDTTFAGVQVMTLKARNGEVRYQLDPRPVRWSDKDEDIPFYLAKRIHSSFTLVKERREATA